MPGSFRFHARSRRENNRDSFIHG